MTTKTILRKLQNGNFDNKLQNKRELIPNKTQASYYKKAYTYTLKVGETHYKVLKSYSTFVCVDNIDLYGNFYFDNHYSNTTTRHIKTFLGRERTPLKKLKELIK